MRGRSISGAAQVHVIKQRVVLVIRLVAAMAFLELGIVNVMSRVHVMVGQAATIRALSLTAGRDRTKQTEGVASAQQASTRTEQKEHALIVHLASTLPQELQRA